MDRSYYEDLAWGGLEDTDAFNSYNEKYRASNIISIELTGNDKHGNPKTQKGQKTGC